MAKLEENTEISIKVDDNEMYVKTIPYSITLVDSNEARVDTPLINGVLHAIILESNGMLHVKISFKEFPNITIFEDMQYNGSNYISLSNQSRDSKGDIVNFANKDWILDDVLVIEIRGAKGVSANVIFKVC